MPVKRARKKIRAKGYPPLEFGPKKNLWFGVSSASLDERSTASWWCLPRSARVGDLLFLYQTLTGVRRIERVISEGLSREVRCGAVGLLTFDTELVVKLVTPLTAKDLKTDAILRELPSVRRNFQGTTFRLPVEFWPRLKRVIATRL
jgi:hypothetical protein